MVGLKNGIALLASVAFLALPQSGNAADDVGFGAIRSHNWAVAERQLLAGLEKNPNNVFRLLNLAWVYAQTGRKQEAAMIYQRILNKDEDQLAALPTGEGKSVKALAERGLTLVQGGG